MGDETYHCVGELQLKDDHLQMLLLRMAHGGIAGADRRGSKRLPCTVRILSRELSSFRAVTVNINATGAELSCDSPVVPGHLMNLQFDLGSVGVPELKMQAICMWSLETVDEARRGSKFRVGVEFSGLNAGAVAAWTKVYRQLLANEGASVMLKTMDGGSVTARNTPNPYQDGSTTSESTSSVVTPAPHVTPAPSVTPAPPAPPASGNPFAVRPQAENPSPSNPFDLSGISTQTEGFTLPPSSQVPSGPPSFSFGQTPIPAPPAPLSPFESGFNSQGAPPPPIAPARLQLNGGGTNGAAPPGPRKLELPGTQLGSGTPPQSGGFAFSPPSAPQQTGGFSFSPPPAQPQTGGFSFNPPPAPPPAGGFSFSPPPASASGGFSFSPPPAQPQAGGFSFNPPPSQQQQTAGFSFSPPPASASGGFPAVPRPPEKVIPLGISGSTLSFRCQSSTSNAPGTLKTLELSFNLGGEVTSVTIKVSLNRVEPGTDGTTVCSATVLEDAEKLRVLNQLL